MTNELARLVRDRMTSLGLTYTDVEKAAKSRGHKISRATVHEIVNKPERRHAPHAKTLKALSAALNYPYEVLAEAAMKSAGYRVTELKTNLSSAGTLRIIAAVHEDLTPEQQSELARMAERYAEELRARVSGRQEGNGS